MGGQVVDAARDAERHRLHDDLRRHAGGADDAAAVQRPGRGHRLHRRHRLRQQHRPRPGRGRPGGQLRRAERLPDLGLHLRACCSAGWSCCRCWCCSRRSSGGAEAAPGARSDLAPWRPARRCGWPAGSGSRPPPRRCGACWRTASRATAPCRRRRSGSRCRATGSSWSPSRRAARRGRASSFSASGTSGSFLKPKFSVTCQQSWPSGSISHALVEADPGHLVVLAR